VEPGEDGAVAVRYEDQLGGGADRREHDLVVLSMGMLPGWNPAGVCPAATARDGFLFAPRPKLSPTHTDLEGVFAAGVAVGPKDIVDSITEAGAAAMEATAYLKRFGSAVGQSPKEASHG
jgi:heterodisulfide reductase subunit A